jgi:4-amino-4-deoxy-L-arabinose transferase-like glycosyltransferase
MWNPILHDQGRHCRFLAGKDALVVATSLPLPLLPLLPPPTFLFSISQNPVKGQALVALPPVAALMTVNKRELTYTCVTNSSAK